MGEVIGFPLSRRVEPKKNGGAWLPYRETPTGQLTLDDAKKTLEHAGKVIMFAGAGAGVDEERVAAVIRFPSERIRVRQVRESSAGGEVVALRPLNALHAAYSLYVRASQLDEDLATYGEAEAMYRRAIQLDPALAIAYTNLGNILFRRGEDGEAEKLYEAAVAIDERQPEAHYNLGYVMLERGDAKRAATHFEKAVARDSRFADAHFNLAMALEQMGSRSEARTHWKRYLDLEPNGTWADIARKHISPAPSPPKAKGRRARRSGDETT